MRNGLWLVAGRLPREDVEEGILGGYRCRRTIEASGCYCAIEELGEFSKVFGHECAKTADVVLFHRTVVLPAFSDYMFEASVADASKSHLDNDFWKVHRINAGPIQKSHHKVIVGGTGKACVEVLAVCKLGLLINGLCDIKSSMGRHPTEFKSGGAK